MQLREEHNSNKRLEQFATADIGMLISMGRNLVFFPKEVIPIVRQALSFLMTKIRKAVDQGDAATIELTYRRFIVGTAMLCVDSFYSWGVERRGHIRQVAGELLQDKYPWTVKDALPTERQQGHNHQPGRSKAHAKVRTKEEEEAAERLRQRSKRDRFMMAEIRQGNVSNALKRLDTNISIGNTSDPTVKQAIRALINPRTPNALHEEYSTLRQTAKESSNTMLDVMDTDATIEVTTEGVLAAIARTKGGVQPGHDRMTIELLKQLLFVNPKANESEQAQIAEFARLYAHIIDVIVLNPGPRIPMSVIRHVTAGKSFCLMYRAENKARVVSAEGMLSKIGGKVFCAATKEAILADNGDMQVGSGERGCGKMVWAAFVDHANGRALSSSDVLQAFNRTNKRDLQKRTQDIIPMATRAIRKLTQGTQDHFIRDKDGKVQVNVQVEGVMQGENIAPSCFIIVANPFNREVEKVVKGPEGNGGGVLTYYDDKITHGVTNEDILRGFKYEVANGKANGVEIQPRKQHIMLAQDSKEETTRYRTEFAQLGVPSRQIHIHPRFDERVTTDAERATAIKNFGIFVVKAPVGSLEFMINAAHSYNKSHTKLIDELLTCESSHMILILAQQALPGRLQYILQTRPPELSQIIIDHFHNMHRRIMARITEQDVEEIKDFSVGLAQQRFKHGGLGLQNGNVARDPAFVIDFLSAMILKCKSSSNDRDALKKVMEVDDNNAALRATQARDPAQLILRPSSPEEFISPYESMIQAMERIRSHVGNEGITIRTLLPRIAKNEPKLQQQLTKPIYLSSYNHIKKFVMASNDAELIAKYISGCSDEAGSALRGVPRFKSEDLTNAQIGVATRRKLHVQNAHLQQAALEECPLCNDRNAATKVNEDHCQRCKALNTLSCRAHNKVVWMLAQFLKGSQMGHVQVEPKYCFAVTQDHSRMDEGDGGVIAGNGLEAMTEKQQDTSQGDFYTNKQRADIMFNTANGNFLIDVMITNEVHKNLTIAQAKIPGRALQAGHKVKVDRYAALCSLNQYIFVPFILEVGGSFSKEAMRFMERIIKGYAEQTAIKPELLRPYWTHQLAMTALQGTTQETVVRTQLIYDKIRSTSTARAHKAGQSDVEEQDDNGDREEGEEDHDVRDIMVFSQAEVDE